MPCLLLDTNILIAAMKGVERVREKLETTPLSEIVLSPVVLGELALGVEKSRHREKNAARLAQVVAGCRSSLSMLPRVVVMVPFAPSWNVRACRLAPTITGLPLRRWPCAPCWLPIMSANSRACRG